MEASEKEKLCSQIDKLEKQQYEKTEEVLKDILPEAFAVMKASVDLFKRNETITAKATDLDRDLAAHVDFIQIIDGNAQYKTSWMVRGIHNPQKAESC